MVYVYSVSQTGGHKVRHPLGSKGRRRRTVEGEVNPKRRLSGVRQSSTVGDIPDRKRPPAIFPLRILPEWSLAPRNICSPREVVLVVMYKRRTVQVFCDTHVDLMCMTAVLNKRMGFSALGRLSYLEIINRPLQLVFVRCVTAFLYLFCFKSVMYGFH